MTIYSWIFFLHWGKNELELDSIASYAFHSFVSIGFLMSPPPHLFEYMMTILCEIAVVSVAVAANINTDTVTPLFHLQNWFENTAKFIAKLICALFNNTPTYWIHSFHIVVVLLLLFVSSIRYILCTLSPCQLNRKCNTDRRHSHPTYIFSAK